MDKEDYLDVVHQLLNQYVDDDYESAEELLRAIGVHEDDMQSVISTIRNWKS